VVFGHGPCFCAGLDLSEHRAREPAEVFHHSRSWHAAFSVLRRGRIPAIAALHGATVGGGLELAAACHLRVADATAFFALPEGSRGIYVGGGASVHVARLIGAPRMMDMMLTGRVLDAGGGGARGPRAVPGAGGRALDKAGSWPPRRGDGAAHRARRLAGAAAHPGHGEDDGLFVESMMAALAQTGPEAAARLADFVASAAPRCPTRPRG
jgi:enoyl-CoA hydratase/carnithine racemase